MNSIKFVLLNVAIAKLLHIFIRYLTDEEHRPEFKSEAENLTASATQRLETQQTYFLPFIITIQFFTTLHFLLIWRNLSSPPNRKLWILKGIIVADILLAFSDIFQLNYFLNYDNDFNFIGNYVNCVLFNKLIDIIQHFSVWAHVILCADMANILPVKIFSVCGIGTISSFLGMSLFVPILTTHTSQKDTRICAVSRIASMEMPYFERMTSLFILPSIFLLIVLSQLWPKCDTIKIALVKPQSSEINFYRFCFISLIMHEIINIAYVYTTIGVHLQNKRIIQIFTYIGEPFLSIYKFGLSIQVANAFGLLLSMSSNIKMEKKV